MYNRTCGGYKDFRDLEIQLRHDRHKYASLEDWFESFPHIYFTFYPSAVIPLYPRDYIYFDNDEVYRLGFDRLDSRIILGGVFMRNYDILFNRIDQTVSIVRSECSRTTDDFKFEEYYFHHSDDQQYKIIKEVSTTEQENSESSPLTKTLLVLIAVIIFSLALCYFVVARRFDRYESNNSIRTEGSQYTSGQIETIGDLELSHAQAPKSDPVTDLNESIEV
jgi:hypothetical protein